MKTLCDRARDIRHGALESRIVARMDDLGRPLTDEETLEECEYLLETIPYAGYPKEDTRDILQACRYLVSKYKKEEA